MGCQVLGFLFRLYLPQLLHVAVLLRRFFVLGCNSVGNELSGSFWSQLLHVAVLVKLRSFIPVRVSDYYFYKT